MLSACQTALGDRQAELGFAGLAVAAGVKSVLASLWNVSDLGTLGLMGQFYQEYGEFANKAEALRQAQLAMLKGQVRVDNGKMMLVEWRKHQSATGVSQRNFRAISSLLLGFFYHNWQLELTKAKFLPNCFLIGDFREIA